MTDGNLKSTNARSATLCILSLNCGLRIRYTTYIKQRFLFQLSFFMSIKDTLISQVSFFSFMFKSISFISLTNYVFLFFVLHLFAKQGNKKFFQGASIIKSLICYVVKDGKNFNYLVGCHPKLEIFSESIGNHFLLLSVASKPLEHYFLGILEFEAQCNIEKKVTPNQRRNNTVLQIQVYPKKMLRGFRSHREQQKVISY